MKKKIFIFFIILIMVSIQTFARSTAGAGSFLKRSVGSRASALGNAFTGIYSDPVSFFYNPAGTALLKNPYMFSTTKLLTNDRTFNAISYSHPLKYGMFSLGYIGFLIKDIPITYEDTSKIVGVDKNGNLLYDIKITGYAKDKKYAVILGYAAQIFKSILLGMNLKLLSQNIYTSKGHGVGLDLGAIVKFSENLSFGLVLKDIFEEIRFSDTNHINDSPYTFATGLSYKAGHGFLINLDAVFEKDEYPDLKFGIEKTFKKRFAIRAGAEYGELTAGLGFRFNNWQIDYSFITKPLGYVHNISAKVEFVPFEFPKKVRRRKKTLTSILSEKQKYGIFINNNRVPESALYKAGTLYFINVETLCNLLLLIHNFNKTTNIHTLTFAKTKVQFKVSHDNIFVNNKWLKLKAPVIKRNGKVFLPLGKIIEIFGGKLSYNLSNTDKSSRISSTF